MHTDSFLQYGTEVCLYYIEYENAFYVSILSTISLMEEEVSVQMEDFKHYDLFT